MTVGRKGRTRSRPKAAWKKLHLERIRRAEAEQRRKRQANELARREASHAISERLKPLVLVAEHEAAVRQEERRVQRLADYIARQGERSRGINRQATRARTRPIPHGTVPADLQGRKDPEWWRHD